MKCVKALKVISTICTILYTIALFICGCVYIGDYDLWWVGLLLWGAILPMYGILMFVYSFSNLVEDNHSMLGSIRIIKIDTETITKKIKKDETETDELPTL